MIAKPLDYDREREGEGVIKVMQDGMACNVDEWTNGVSREEEQC